MKLHAVSENEAFGGQRHFHKIPVLEAILKRKPDRKGKETEWEVKESFEIIEMDPNRERKEDDFLNWELNI